jgi:lipopolysaccharide export system protein LptA
MQRVTVIMLVLCLAGSVEAKGPAPLLRNSQPIQLKSDHLATDSTNRTARFTGRVTAQQGDLTILCDELVVRYAEKGNDVEDVTATGNVRITQGERSAFAGRAVYDNKGGMIRLDQSPRVQQGDNTIVGATIDYHVNELKSVVSGGPGQRVEAVIRPGSDLRTPGLK